MSARRASLAFGLLLAFGLGADAPADRPVGADAAPPIPTLADPFPFDHEEHSSVFEDVGLACVDCHPVGATSKEKEGPQVSPETPPPPRSTCHSCHRHAVRGAPRGAPPSCLTCHTVRAELIPPSHDAFWMEEHGGAARGLATDCSDCHEPTGCVACHERRGALSRNPHGAAFRSAHGIEARLDPVSCSSCHAGDTCTSCHTRGGLPL